MATLNRGFSMPLFRLAKFQTGFPPNLWTSVTPSPGTTQPRRFLRNAVSGWNQGRFCQRISIWLWIVMDICHGYIMSIGYISYYIYIYKSILNYLACTYQCQSVYLFLDVDILFVHMYCTYRSICKRTCRCVRVFCWLSEKNVSAQVDVNNICIGNIEYICRHIYVYVHVHSYLSM